jgi:hypothetical protein
MNGARTRSVASPLMGEIVQAVGVLIILAALVWGFVDGARLFAACVSLGFAWFFLGRWLRHRSGVH